MGKLKSSRDDLNTHDQLTLKESQDLEETKLKIEKVLSKLDQLETEEQDENK